MRKKGKTTGWELMLSYSLRDNIITGFAKGTASSEVTAVMDHLKGCAEQVSHPFLLPILILSHELSSRNEQKQRNAREWLRKLEQALSMRSEVDSADGYITDNFLNMDAINRDLAECHSQVLWKNPKAWYKIVGRIEKAMGFFWAELPEQRKTPELIKLHQTMLSRLDFYKVKLEGIEHYASITMERLNIQRGVLHNIIGQKESRLNLEMAGQQRLLAHVGKRDTQAMKTLALLGSIFLPGTYLASLFSMTFFNFQNNDESSVSPRLWIYFVVMVPLTVMVVGAWLWWDRRREREFASEEVNIENDINKMESQIMQTMRLRTISKARTWEVGIG